VLGIDDGLVSNFSLVMGVAGAGGDARAIAVAGLAGLLAGSLSMALGEWLSVQSARELYARQIAVEREELVAAPEEEEQELALIYQAKGATETQARALARQIMQSDRALETLAREELAIDPGELGGSAYVAAGTSFAMFAMGALVPLVPFAFASGTTAVIAIAAVLWWSATASAQLDPLLFVKQKKLKIKEDIRFRLAPDDGPHIGRSHEATPRPAPHHHPGIHD